MATETTPMDQPQQLLPDDVLSDVLRRLGPYGVAASRCVCKAWHDVVDARCPLPADAHLLPLSMAGIFTVFSCPANTGYFSRPGSSKITVNFDYTGIHDFECLEIEDHCNGLLLLYPAPFFPDEEQVHVHVLNPATRQWTRLPRCPDFSVYGMDAGYEALDMYLAFDPALSPHYQVFLFNSAPTKFADELEPAIKNLEWPPSQYVLRVFSSRTSQWEMKPFIRQGEAAGTIGDMNKAISPCGNAAYWRGALYVPQHDFVIRVILSNDKFQVIKLPLFLDVGADPDHYIGKCQNGVYCALLYGDAELALRVWFLDESCGQPKWELKDFIDFETVLANPTSKYGEKHWVVQYADDEDDKGERYTISLLGFHPYREIFFLQTSFGRAVAYHFNSSKIEDIGCFPTKDDNGTITGFPYTPCRVGDLSDIKFV